jgi:hypothetical protein
MIFSALWFKTTYMHQDCERFVLTLSIPYPFLHPEELIGFLVPLQNPFLLGTTKTASRFLLVVTLPWWSPVNHPY